MIAHIAVRRAISLSSNRVWPPSAFHRVLIPHATKQLRDHDGCPRLDVDRRIDRQEVVMMFGCGAGDLRFENGGGDIVIQRMKTCILKCTRVVLRRSTKKAQGRRQVAVVETLTSILLTRHQPTSCLTNWPVYSMFHTRLKTDRFSKLYRQKAQGDESKAFNSRSSIRPHRQGSPSRRSVRSRPSTEEYPRYLRIRPQTEHPPGTCH